MIPDTLKQIAEVMLELAPIGAIFALILAGLSLRGGNIADLIGGSSFSRYMFWAIVLITAPQLLEWFPALGLGTPDVTGSHTPIWFHDIVLNLNTFTSSFVEGALLPVLSAFFLLRAVLEFAQGMNPISSLIASIFLLCVPSTLVMLNGFNTGTQFATSDILTQLWNYLAGRICPICAVLGVIAGIWNLSRSRSVFVPWGAALAMLSITSFWRLMNSWLS